MAILNCVLAKTIAYFHIFTPRFFFCNYTFSYCMKPSEMCLHIYSLPSSAFLKYQTSGFYCTWSKSHPLVDIRACTLCKSFIFITVFFHKFWTGHRYFHKQLTWSYIQRSLVKKSIPDWHLVITQMERKWTKWYAMTSHVIAYRSLELLFGAHTFHFNCFFEDFNCVFTQIRCLSRVLGLAYILRYVKAPVYICRHQMINVTCRAW